jgi:hypothetical protein
MFEVAGFFCWFVCFWLGWGLPVGVCWPGPGLGQFLFVGFFIFLNYGSEEFKTQDLTIYGRWVFLGLVWWGCMRGTSCLVGMDD